MFTGIVDHGGEIVEARQSASGLRLRVRCRFEDLVVGESIAVDGCCLTVTTKTAGEFTCDLSVETLRLTRAAAYRAGQKVNLERALKMGDRLGGHVVTGHVDRTVRVLAKEPSDGFVGFRFGPFSPAELGYLVPKGSIALNGVSLTLNEVGSDWVSVLLIPHTLEITNLGALAVGDAVNVELDWMTKVILNDARLARERLKESTL